MYKPKSRAYPIISIGILSLLVFCGTQMTSGQICGPAEIDYIIRDSTGHVINPATLTASGFVNEKAEYWKREATKTSFSKSGNGKDLIEVRSLRYSGRADCKLNLSELTLRLGGKTMHLIFGLSLDSYNDREHSHRVIDSLPFDQGTFKLEPTPDANIPASKWKRVSAKP
jgi:hypothetical protein